MMETDYHKARELFEQTAGAAGLRTVRTRVPYENQPDLFIDFAFQKRDPNKLLVQLSGVHGIEGYAGSTIQREVLKGLPQGGPSLLFVHAVNPYGMCLYRRANGNNVDLNRSFNLKTVTNEDYKFFDAYLNPNSGLQFYTGFLKAVFSRYTLGETRSRQAIAAGQMTHPHGIFFCGREIQREVKLVQEVLRSHFAGIQQYTVLDLHTGLGEFAGEMLFVDHDRETDSPDYFEKIFGRKADVPDPGAGSYEIHGRISDAFRQVLPKAKLRYCLQEFGTLNALKTIHALRKENFEWRFRAPGSPPSDGVRDAMLAAFGPNDETWQKRITELGIERWKQAWGALA
ncbi:MAG TPA: DUF2817 domain-containing protein [Bdellovibrionota bacterium]|jgi:hypothetical protein